MNKEEVKYWTLNINVYTTNNIKSVNLINNKVKLMGAKIIKYRRFRPVNFYSVWILEVPIFVCNFVVNKFNSNPKWHIFTDIIFQYNSAKLFALVTKHQGVGRGGHLFLKVNGLSTLNKNYVHLVLFSKLKWYSNWYVLPLSYFKVLLDKYFLWII